MNRTTINGITIEGNHKSVVVKNGQVYVDGKLVNENYNGAIIINGNVDNVNGTSIEINGNVTGDVDGTNITINGNVTGDVDGANVKIMGEKRTAKSSFDLDVYDDLEKKLNQKLRLIENNISKINPELDEVCTRTDEITETSKKENDLEGMDLKDLVKKNKKKKKK